MAEYAHASGNDARHGSQTADSTPEGIVDGKLEMSQDEIDAIIRNKRKLRDPKACYACHRRKVKCDRNLPCDSCVKRDHPELCSYERPTKKRRIALSNALGQVEDGVHGDEDVVPQSSGPNITVPRQQWERLNRELQQLRGTVKAEQRLTPGPTHSEGDEQNPASGTQSRGDETEGVGIHAPSTQMGTMHLGSRSVVAYMYGLGRSKSTQEGAKSLLEENILPKLGLDNESATYPFVDLWSTESNLQDVEGLCKVIPEDQRCKDFFVAYRDVACTIYPVVPRCDKFGDTLDFMLRNRHLAQRDNLKLDPNKPYGISLPFLSLVFAVLASGSQTTNLPAKERELTSQVYICCSYQALRMSNFLTHPSLETIQSSLIIGNVLAYNMNPGVAYIFLGMTLRMAFSIGLQINPSPSFTPEEAWTRRRIWWAMAWQDSHFAVSYDRPTSSVLSTPDIPYGQFSSPGDRSYAETMYAIIRLTQEIIRERLLRPRSYMSWDRIRKYTEEITSHVGQGTEHLRDRRLCHATTQHLERLALKLHSCYVTSELCRPALKEVATPRSNMAVSGDGLTPKSPPIAGGRRRASGSGAQATSTSSNPSIDPATLEQFRTKCIASLQGCVEAYVELHSISPFASRSWIGIQRAISAAFMLGTLSETSRNKPRLALLRDLEKAISERMYGDPSFDVQRKRKFSGSEDTDPNVDNPHWAKTMTKSLHALGKMNEVIAGTKPMHPSQLGQLPQQARQRPTLTTTHGAASQVAKDPTESLLPQHFSYSQQPVSVKQEYPSSIVGPGLASGAQGSTRAYNMAAPVATGMLGGPITPDSTSGSSTGDWNFTNLGERAQEFIINPIWGNTEVDVGWGMNDWQG